MLLICVIDLKFPFFCICYLNKLPTYPDDKLASTHLFLRSVNYIRESDNRELSDVVVRINEPTSQIVHDHFEQYFAVSRILTNQLNISIVA